VRLLKAIREHGVIEAVRRWWSSSTIPQKTSLVSLLMSVTNVAIVFGLRSRIREEKAHAADR